MKKTLRELEALFTFASMIGFIVFAILGLRSLDGKGELDREVENAQCNREHRAADRCAAVVVPPDEVDCLQNILLCMFCLFNLLLPVVFNNIIPNQTSQMTS